MARALPFIGVVALLAGVAPAWAGAGHTLEVRFADGKTVFVQKVGLEEGRQVNFAGPVTGRDGTRRQAIINALLSADSGAFELQYQLELSGDAGGSSIQGQGDAMMRSKDSVTAVQCRRWRIDLTLDGSKREGDKGTAWDPSGLGNLRVTAELSAGQERLTCRQVLKPGVQGNVLDSLRMGDERFGLVMSMLPVPSLHANTIDLQYQLSYTPLRAPVRAFQAQSQQTLTPGRKSVSETSGYKLELTVEGGRPSK